MWIIFKRKEIVLGESKGGGRRNFSMGEERKFFWKAYGECSLINEFG